MSKHGEHSAEVTIDHDEIREWAEERGGKPATVKGTGGKEEAGVLRIDFPGGAGDRLEPISWEEFFRKFDDSHLAFLYQETTADGEQSRFCKFINRESAGKKAAA